MEGPPPYRGPASFSIISHALGVSPPPPRHWEWLNAETEAHLNSGLEVS